MKDFFLHSLQFFVCRFFCKWTECISWARIRRNQVTVEMWRLISDHRESDSLTPSSFLYSGSELLRDLKYSRVIWLRYVSKIVYFALWYDEYMPFLDRVDIEKCICILIFVELIRRKFSWDEFRENGGHKVDYRFELIADRLRRFWFDKRDEHFRNFFNPWKKFISYFLS